MRRHKPVFIALLAVALCLIAAPDRLIAAPPSPPASGSYVSPALLPGQPSEPRLEAYCSFSHFRAASFTYEYVVESSGKVTHARFLVPPSVAPACPAFHNAYLRWVRSLRYKPALSEGKPVAVFVTAQALIHFR